MVFQVLTTSLTAFLIRISIFLIRRLLFSTSTDNPIFLEITRISKTLAVAVPESVIEFEISLCIVCPRNDKELCAAIKIIKREYDERKKEQVGGEHVSERLFAIHGGGYSYVAGAASIEGGVLIDLSCFNEVISSEVNNESCVIIGTGCRSLSFFFPKFGLVCSKIIRYDIILASGSLTTASATQNPDLWRALKAGSNNFGIVTRFTARSFSSIKIWSGFLYVPNSQTSKVISAFHDVVNRVDWDHHAAGPLAYFTYIQPLGL
ncbi:hypothetical protein ACHAP3_004641 [Botrytis cinerea]